MVSGEGEAGHEDPSEDPFVGTVLNGRFQIVKRIARGGMSSVYSATQVPLSRPVAIKVVRCVNPGSEGDFRRRFLRETSILAQLQHPNIVTLIDYGPISGGSEEHYFMAMEYLSGETLAKRFKRTGRLRIEESIRIARQIGRGLREAHRRGFIHRDLKPSNIMLVPEDDDNDIVKLVDFGIGKIVAAQAELPTDQDVDEMTRVGLLLGSPRYMSPEQIRSEPVELRTDLYGLGVILFQALTGRLPFEGKTEVDILIAHCSITPPELAEACPDQIFPESLSRLVRSLLEKKAKNRPTIEEFLDRLAGVEEEVFGTVSLAGPTLPGLRLSPPPFRPSSSYAIAPSGAISGRGVQERPPHDGTSHEGTSADTISVEALSDLDMTPTPVLGTALPTPPAAPAQAPRHRPLRFAGAWGALLFLLVSALFWIVAKPSRRDRGQEGPWARPAPPTIPAPAATRATASAAATNVAAVTLGPRSFTLAIDSVPADALVTEGGRLIGTTPLTLTIERSSVSTEPRQFVLRHEGYAPAVIEQGDSMTTVRASAALSAIGRGGGTPRPRRLSTTRRGGNTASTPVAEISLAPAVMGRGKSSGLSRTGSLDSAPLGPAPASGAPAPKSGRAPPQLEIRTRR